jgi:hypothetical protein
MRILILLRGNMLEAGVYRLVQPGIIYALPIQQSNKAG